MDGKTKTMMPLDEIDELNAIAESLRLGLSVAFTVLGEMYDRQVDAASIDNLDWILQQQQATVDRLRRFGEGLCPARAAAAVA